MRHNYERLKEDGDLEYCPTYDYDGSITGKIVVNVPAYFDENPEERIRLGWVKHIRYDKDEIAEQVGGWNRQTQFLARSTRQIDEHTIEDVYHVMDKSEEMLLMEEMSESTGGFGIDDGRIIFFDGEEM